MTRSNRFGIAVVAILALTTAGRLTAQPAGAGTPVRVALVNANVVDVITGAVQDGQTLVLSGGRIESIGAAPPPSGVRVIDLRNRWVVPGPHRRARAHRQPAADARGAAVGRDHRP